MFTVPSGISNPSMRDTPDRPARMFAQESAIVRPQGVTAPIPEITTRRLP